jgi:hypothetical protein
MPKYNNKKTELDGIIFDSKKEAKRYWELKLLEKAGKIEKLKLQPAFELKVNNEKICTYKADFEYIDRSKYNVVVVEDVKGVKTPVYNLKKKLMKAIYKIDIFET